MKLDEMNYSAPGGEQVSGDEIQNMVQNFVAAGKGKPGMHMGPQLDPAIAQYHKDQDRIRL
jgi:hypothetical protein